MSKGSNNTRNKKGHLSKPYDVSNSFVRKVTSGVSNLLPHPSWLSRWWFTFRSIPEEKQNVSIKSDNQTEVVTPPPKRTKASLNHTSPGANSFHISSPARDGTHSWPSTSVVSPIPNAFDSSVAGPSGLVKTPVAPPTDQASDSACPEGIEGKVNGDGGSESSESTSHCSSLPPQQTTTSTTSNKLSASVGNRKGFVNNVQPQSSQLPSYTPKSSPLLSRQRPSFNVSSFGSSVLDASKLSRESSLNSPFYMGRTMYGGASAYRRPHGSMISVEPMSFTRRSGVTIRPVNEKHSTSVVADICVSRTARRILETLEAYSSPVSDARRMPLSRSILGSKRRRVDSCTNSADLHDKNAALSPLTIPASPDILRLQKLQDVTEAARKLANSMPSELYSIRTRFEDIKSDDSRLGGTGKVTKSRPMDEKDYPAPVNLPKVSLPITTLPKFDLFTQTPNHVMNRQLNIESASNESDLLKQAIPKTVTAPDNPKPSIYSSKSIVPNSASKEIELRVCKNSIGNTPSSDSMSFLCTSSTSNFTYTPPLIANTNLTSLSSIGTDVLDKRNKKEKAAFGVVTSDSTNIFKGNAVTKEANTNNNILSKNECFDFVPPKIISTDKVVAGSVVKTDNFDFEDLQPFVCEKCFSILKHGEHNGFRKHNCSKLEEGNGSVLVLNANCKVSSKQNKQDDMSGADFAVSISNIREKEINAGESNANSTAETWVCPKCLIRNICDSAYCVCCRNKQPAPQSLTSEGSKVNTLTSSPTLSKTSWGSQFQLQPGMWECTICLVRNKNTDQKCVSCTSPRSETKTTLTSESSSTKPQQSVPLESKGWGTRFQLQPGMWECSTCLVRNKEVDSTCVSCTSPRPGISASPATEPLKPQNCGFGNSVVQHVGGFGDKFKTPVSSWECPVCMIHNKDSILKCAACQEPKPGINSSISNTGSNIKFNFDMPAGAGDFKFGIDKAEDKQPTSNSVGFSFGNSTISSGYSGFRFGSTTTESKLPSGFTFGTHSNVSSLPSTQIATKPQVLLTSSSSSKGDTGPSRVEKTVLETTVASKTGSVTFGNQMKSTCENIHKQSPIGGTKGFKFGAQVSPAKCAAVEKESTTNVPVSKYEPNLVDGKGSVGFHFGVPVSTQVMTTLSTCAATFTFTTATTTSKPFVALPTKSVSSATTVHMTPATSTTASTIPKAATTLSSGFSFGAPPGIFQHSGERLFGNKTPMTTTTSVFGGSSGATAKAAASPSTRSFGSTPATTATVTFGHTPDAAFGTPKPSSGTFNAGLSRTADMTIATQGSIPNTAAPKTSVFSFGNKNSTNVSMTTAPSTGPSQAFGGFTFTTGGSNPPPLFGNSVATSVAAPTASVFGSRGDATSSTQASGFGANTAVSDAGAFGQGFSFAARPANQQFGFGNGSQAVSTQPSGLPFLQYQGQAQPPTFNPNVRPNFCFTQGDTPQFTASGALPAPAGPQRRVKKAVRRNIR